MNMLIMVADDHRLMREVLVKVLRGMGQLDHAEIVEAETYADVLAFAHSGRKPDLVLLDYCMPGGENLAAVRAVISAFDGCPVVLVSGSADGQLALACLGFGAAGFISKSVSGGSLRNALRVVLDGEKYVPSFALCNPLQNRAPSNHPASSTTGRRPSVWTEREAQVLKFLMEGATNKGIARQLDIGEMTVKTHVRNIYRKLGARNRADAVNRVMSSHSSP